jgi:hypothetical protein
MAPHAALLLLIGKKLRDQYDDPETRAAFDTLISAVEDLVTSAGDDARVPTTEKKEENPAPGPSPAPEVKQS